jgi:hypothetical protein
MVLNHPGPLDPFGTMGTDEIEFCFFYAGIHTRSAIEDWKTNVETSEGVRRFSLLPFANSDLPRLSSEGPEV